MLSGGISPLMALLYIPSQVVGGILGASVCRVRTAQQARDIYPILGQCWASVVDDGPALVHHWVYFACLLGVDIFVIFTVTIICFNNLSLIWIILIYV